MLHSEEYKQNINTLNQKIEESDAIVIGGAAGMSEAIGHTSFYWADENFKKHFGKFIDKFGIRNRFMGYHYPYPTREDRWGFLTTSIKLTRDAEAGKPYLDLSKIIQDKNYFIVTTNQDVQFSKVFPDDKIALIQGDFRYFQCSARCHDQIYDNKDQIDKMYENMEGTQVPADLIPVCAKCGHDMEPWVRSYEFLEGSFYQNELRKYKDFIVENQDKKVLFLELGVGSMTPMFIKEPFWNMTYSFPNAYYITINPKDAVVHPAISEKGLAVKEDIADVLEDLLFESTK